MNHIWKTIQLTGLLGSVCLTAVPSTTVSAAEVIRDDNWTIQIRPAGRHSRNTSPARVPGVIPARHEAPAAPVAQPAPEPAPVPEGTAIPAPAAQANPAVQPAPAPGPMTTSQPSTGPLTTPSTNVEPAPRSVDLVPGVQPRITSYEEAYAAVPFSRTEYEANPTYRHQAALELLFGTLRPMTTVQNYTPRAFRYPDSYQMPYIRTDTQHINLRTINDGPTYTGQSPFGYPYGVKGN